MTRLVCPECRKENEAERIYCHDCGARLDRTALAKAPEKAESPQEAHRRVKKIFSPSGVRLRQIFFKTAKVLLAAFVAAAVIQMLLPPDVPPPPKSTGLALQVTMDLEEAVRTHGAPLRYSEEQANSYLAYALKTKQKGLNGITQFERAVVKFDETTCKFTIARSFYGYAFYVGGLYRVAVQNGTLVADQKGGSIGRLPVHPQLMKFGGSLFGDVAAALDRERKLLAKMSAVEFHPQLVAVTP